MKIINKKAISQVIIASLLISTAFANGFPSEPMVIYGNIDNASSGSMNIYDGSDNLLKATTISNGSYGTDSAFDLSNKVTLSEFSGALRFEINGSTVQPDDTSTCSSSGLFQAGALCSYNFGGTSNNQEEIDTSGEYLNNLDEGDFTTDFNAIGSGTIVRDTKSNLIADLGSNILKDLSDNKEVLVFSDEVQITRKTVKDIVVIGDTKTESIFIGSGTVITQSGAEIGSPVEILQSNAVSINLPASNVRVGAGIKIPTNQSLNFDTAIRICVATTMTSTSNAVVYSSQDDITWTRDTSANDFNISNGQICFDTNHLTSFAVGNTFSTGGGTGGGGGGGSASSSSSNSSSPASQLLSVIDSTSDSSSEDIDETSTGAIFISSKDYINNLRKFNESSKKTIKVLGIEMINLKDNDDYNKGMNKYALKSIAGVTLKPLQEKILEFFDDATITYGIYTDPTLDESLKGVYKQKLIDDLQDLDQAIKNIQTKDRILKKHFESQ